MVNKVLLLDEIDDASEDAPDLVRLREMMVARDGCAEVVKKETARRKDLDGEISGLLMQMETTSARVGDIVVSEVIRQGAVRWDSKFLQRVLKPEDLEKAQARGNDSVSLRFSIAKD